MHSKIGKFILILITFTYLMSLLTVSSEEIRDTYPDTWVATDNLGRTTPLNTDVGDPKDKKVGIFYFLWHNNNSTQPLYDHYKTYKEEGLDALKTLMRSGPLGYAHYWAEPYFGYYRTNDEWVLRKHAYQLSNAGIDFVFFDVSNGVMYENQYITLLETWQQIRQEGGMTPQFIFFCGDNDTIGQSDMDTAWRTVYKDQKYKELWFMWEGKPLILGNFSKVSQEIKDFFTIRRSWAFNGWTGDGVGRWPWIAESPQKPGKNFEGIVEQMTVACGFHATTSRGRSFSNKMQPTDGKSAFEFELAETPLGLAFDEQWKEALKVNPPLIMVTGWNEWWAGRWEDSDAGMFFANTYTITKGDPVYKHFYVDNFNPEFSRDIEAMKGGFGDNYYYQMVSWIRRYKGVREIPVNEITKGINIKGGFDQWNEISVKYIDTLYDTAHRNSKSSGGKIDYINETGRNDFEYMKVTRDNDNIYFLAVTRDDITDPEGENWMNLLIDIDTDYGTGVHGYDFVVNRSRDDKYVSIERVVNNSWDFEPIGQAEYRVEGNQIMISIPQEILGVDKSQSFDFKWADNSTVTGDVMQFSDLGDAAPDDRFNFRYLDQFVKTEKTEKNKSNTMVYILIAEAVFVLALVVGFVILIKKLKKN